MMKVSTPFDLSVKLQKNDARVVVQLESERACNVLDLTYHLQLVKLVNFTSNPNGEHWKTIITIFGYLMKTKNLDLHYGRFSVILEGYTDASWISSVEYHKSAFVWIFTLVGGTISWKSKK